jgi:hypothetical protein
MSSLQNEGTPSPAVGAHRIEMLCASIASPYSSLSVGSLMTICHNCRCEPGGEPNAPASVLCSQIDRSDFSSFVSFSFVLLPYPFARTPFENARCSNWIETISTTCCSVNSRAVNPIEPRSSRDGQS